MSDVTKPLHVSDVTESLHDPLCENSGTRFCLECEFIAQIRKDQMEKDISRFSFMFEYIVGEMTDGQKQRFEELMGIITAVKKVNDGS